MLTRLRWSAFGLRGRIFGAVLVTAAITLGVAALVLLPQLEHSLRDASRKTLNSDIGKIPRTKRGDVDVLKQIQYSLVVPALLSSSITPSDKRLAQFAEDQNKALGTALGNLYTELGATSVVLFGSMYPTGDGGAHGQAIAPVSSSAAAAAPGTPAISSATYPNVAKAFLNNRIYYSFNVVDNKQYVEAAIPVGQDAVVAVTKSIDEIPLAVQAVRKAFEIAAGAAILLALLIAIPLAGTLVSRLQRLREAALHIAIDGSANATFPVDRARDEVGDLARSFSIMQRRLRQQEEARRAFVATASHELRTPLTSLEGMLELLADDLQADNLDLADASVMLERARAQSRRLGRLAADLLDLSRIDADVALRSELIELGELGRAVLAEFDLASAERGVNAVLMDSAAPAWALADPGSVARIVRILLDNALRVAPRGSEVKLVITAHPLPTLSVVDSGPGVAPEERALIFERFKRGRETGGEAGFGLGLAIGRELAQRMGGSLALADTDGPGAMFVLTLRPAQAPSPDQLASTAGV